MIFVIIVSWRTRKMNVRDIKLKARTVLANRQNVMGVFVFISVVGTLANAIGAELSGVMAILGLLVSLVMLPFSHGNVVVALKTVNERGDEVSIEQDGVVGFRRFKDLFFTYFIEEALLVVIIILIGLLFLVIARFTIGDQVFEQMGTLIKEGLLYSSGVESYISNSLMVEASKKVGSLFGIAIIVIFIVSTMYNLFFALTPFVLEKYDLRGVKAMSESFRLMKGHKGTLFMLYLSYLGWAFFSILLASVFGLIFSSTIVISVITAVIITYVFGAHLNVSTAVLFEEIDLEDKNKI